MISFKGLVNCFEEGNKRKQSYSATVLYTVVDSEKLKSAVLVLQNSFSLYSTLNSIFKSNTNFVAQ